MPLGTQIDHPRLGEVAAAVHLLDEEPQHLLGRLEVGDHAVLERADGGDVVGRAADHPLGLVADGEDLAGGGVERDHAGLVEQHALAADVDQRVGGAEVHGHVAADEAVRHADASQSSSALVGKVGTRSVTHPRVERKSATGRSPGGHARAASVG